MNEAELQTLAEYMRAAIRAHRPHELESLSFDELRGVFHATPKSRINFQEWISRMNIKTEPEEQVEPTEDEKAEQNERAIEAWAKLAEENPAMTIKVAPKKDE